MFPHQLYMPFIQHDEERTLAQQFIRLWLSASWQQRQDALADPRLMQAAQDHAEWLAAHNLATHEGADGLNANDRVRMEDYRLPLWYPTGQNNIESIAVDWQGPPAWLERLYTSPYHHDHVAGWGFFNDQTRYGVGVSGKPDEAPAWLVLVTAPVETTDPEKES